MRNVCVRFNSITFVRRKHCTRDTDAEIKRYAIKPLTHHAALLQLLPQRRLELRHRHGAKQCAT